MIEEVTIYFARHEKCPDLSYMGESLEEIEECHMAHPDCRESYLPVQEIIGTIDEVASFIAEELRVF